MFGVAAVVNTVPTWILFPYCSEDCPLTLQCLYIARVAVEWVTLHFTYKQQKYSFLPQLLLLSCAEDPVASP